MRATEADARDDKGSIAFAGRGCPWAKVCVLGRVPWCRVRWQRSV